ncbi:MAG: DUF6455 family protein [Rhizobiaceae bacterium]
MAVIKFFDRMFRHMDLMDRMMDTLGVTARIKAVPGAANVLRRATIRCMGCDSTKACGAFLDSHESADDAPAYCRNHDLFERLKRQIDAEQAA